MSRQERGNMKRCSSCTGSYKASTLGGTHLVTGDKCPTCEAADRVIQTLEMIRQRGAASGV